MERGRLRGPAQSAFTAEELLRPHAALGPGLLLQPQALPNSAFPGFGENCEGLAVVLGVSFQTRTLEKTQSLTL